MLCHLSLGAGGIASVVREKPKTVCEKGIPLSCALGYCCHRKDGDHHDKRKDHRLGGMCGSNPCKRHPAADSDGRNPMDGLYKNSRTGNGKHPHQRSMAKKAGICPDANAGLQAPVHYSSGRAATDAGTCCPNAYICPGTGQRLRPMLLRRNPQPRRTRAPHESPRIKRRIPQLQRILKPITA